MKQFILPKLITELNFDNDRQRIYCYYIIHKILSVKLLYRLSNDFIELNSQKLKKTLGNNYHQYIQYLVDNSVLRVNHSYSATSSLYNTNPFCKSYSLSADYLNSDIINIPITNNRFIDKLTKMKTIQYNDLPLTYKTILHNIDRLSIDSNSALQSCYDNYENQFQFNSWQSAVHCITNKQFFFVKDVYGRFHNNITNLPRLLRNYLSIDGNKLVEIDISNTQPLLLLRLFNQFFEMPIPNITNNTLNIDNNIDCNIQYTISPSLSLPYVVQNEERIKYRELVLNGQLYDYLLEIYNKTYDLELSRSEFKNKLIAQVFFSKNTEQYTYWRISKIFEQEFPLLYKLIREYKKQDYTKLSKSLQRLESFIVIEKIGTELVKQNIFFITIHDGILTTPDNIKTITTIINNVFNREYNFMPSIKIK